MDWKVTSKKRERLSVQHVNLPMGKFQTKNFEEFLFDYLVGVKSMVFIYYIHLMSVLLPLLQKDSISIIYWMDYVHKVGI